MDLYHKSIVVTTKTLNPELVPCVTECNPLLNHVGLCSGPCFRACPVVCKTLGVPQPLPPLFPLFSPPLPPPPPPQQSLVGPPPFVLEDKNNQKGMITTSVIVMACIIGVALVFGIIFTILGIHIRRRNSRRSTREEPGFIEDFDQGQGPLQQIDNPIWYIRTVGLQRSVIDSISMIRYKKGEGLIEGTDCSVCLSGFQEDESVRLLPKCSHAFHVECIDTWLSSHKNCPLCRAPIVRSSFDGRVGLVVSTMSGSSSSDEERRLPSSEDSTSGRLMSNSVVEDGSSEDVNGNEDASTQIEQDVDVGCPGTSIEDSTLRSHSGVKTESVKNVQTEMQTIRRSASLDSSSALSIYDAVANGFPQLTNWKVKNMIKRGSSGSSSFNKELRRSSMVHSLATKRSLSSSWRMSTFKRSRSQESILPF